VRRVARTLPLLTLAGLFVGYACSYFHRSDLATLATVLQHDDTRAQLRAALPDLASLGLLVYACGKVAGGLLAARVGARTLFVLALAGAGIAELLALAARTPFAFACCRAGGMLALGCAWPALGHVVAAMTPAARLATVMAVLAQSYLLGDAAVRAVLAAVVANGGGGDGVLGTCATGLLGGAAIAVALFASDRRRHAAAASGVAREHAAAAPPAGAPGAGRRAHAGWLALVAGMNFVGSLAREGLALWTPLLLVETCRAAPADAVRASAWLPLAGGAGALLAGLLADRGPRALFAATFVPATLAAAVLAGLAASGAASFAATVAALTVASGCIAMPLTLASGVLPLRGSVAGSARRLGLVDGAGSFGGAFAGSALARVQGDGGSSGMLAVLAGVVGAGAVLAALAHAVRGRIAAAPPRR
jgi:sugar phosphate permease